MSFMKRSRHGALNVIPQTSVIQETPSFIRSSTIFLGIFILFICYSLSSFISDIPVLNFIFTPVIWIKDLVVGSISSIITIVTFPIRWLIGYVPDIELPDVELPKISLNLGDQDTDEEQQTHEKEIQYKTQKAETKTSTIEATSSKKIHKSKKSTLLENYKSIGAASISAQEIATAHDQGREEILKHHKSIGASSLTSEEIAMAHNQGKEEALKEHKLLGASSITPEEILEISAKGKEERKVEIFNTATKMTTDLIKTIRENAVDASYISLLRAVEIEANDPEIIDKAMFCTELTQCLKNSESIPGCNDHTIRSLGITYNEEICP